MTKPFSQEHLERIQEAYDRIMADESLKVATSVKNRIQNVAHLFGYPEMNASVTVTINSSYSMVLSEDK